MEKEVELTLELIRECSVYAGGGYFIRPGASPKNPSPLLRAVDVREFLLKMITK